MIKLGIIGCGYWGKNLIRNIVESDKTQLVVACDLSPKALARIKAKYPSVITTTSSEDVFKHKDLDGIIIATDPTSHYALAKQAILHGKDVFVEKPLTISTKTTEDLIRLADKHQRILMVGHTFEFAPAIIKGEEIIKNQLGKIIYASFLST